MNEQIFLVDHNKKLIELNETNYVNEADLQSLLENYPNLISGSQINPENPRRWILISREVGIPSEDNGSNIWSVDHLFLDQEGIPTLVEVKRSTDTRIRREVVGQMLDYAANSVSYWTIETIKLKFEQNCEKAGLDPEVELSTLLEGESDMNKFWETVNTNLQAGKIRLLFIADKIPRELQRIIEFLNEQMSPAEVLGVEIKQYSNQQLKTLVPRVIGKTSSASIKKGNRDKDYKKWNYDAFMEEIGTRGTEYPRIVDKIMDHLKNRVYFWYGEGLTRGSLVPIYNHINKHQLFAIWSDASIEIYFQYYKSKPPFNTPAKRRELLEKLNSIPGVDLPEDRLEKRPSFHMEILKDEKNLQSFLEIYDWFLEEIRKG